MNKQRLERGIKKLKAGLDDCHREMREFEIKQLDGIIEGLSFHLSHYERRLVASALRSPPTLSFHLSHYESVEKQDKKEGVKLNEWRKTILFN